MVKLAVLLSLSLAAAHAATIDSGYVFTRPYFVSDATAVVFYFFVHRR